MVEERGSSRGNRDDRGSSRGSSWGSSEDRGSSHGGKGMGASTPKARLQRLSAKKDREYNPDLNSNDLDDDSVHSARSPGRSPLARDDKIFTRQDSFRVGGNEDDLQKLYEFLGVGSPAGLGIEASDWEARKSLINSRPPSPRSVAVDSGQASYSDGFQGFQQSSFDSSAGSPPSPRLSPVRPIERDWRAYRENFLNSQPVSRSGRDNSPVRRSPPPPTEFPHPGGFRALTRSVHSIDKSIVPHISVIGREGTLLNRRHSEPFPPLESTPSSARADFTEAHSAPSDALGKALVLEPPAQGGEPVRRSPFFGDDLPSAAVALPGSGRRSSIKDPHRTKSCGSLRWRSSSHAPEAESIVNPPEELPVVTESNNTEDRETIEKPSVVVEKLEETLTLASSGGSIESLPGVIPKSPSWTSWAKGELLGSGTFGTVYEGVGSNGTFFAVKEVSLSDQGRSGKQAIRQLEQEIAVLSEIQHPNIVQYLGTERDDEKLYIFLELVSKGSLAHVYNKYELFIEQVRSYTKQILSGLKYLHDRKIIHRDIKCANILVDASGVVKLADFGMAKQTDKLGLLKSFMGSAHWMAPEVVNPKRSYNLMADIWSLGCTVLEMAIGKPPFGELEAHGVLWKVGHGEGPPIPEDLPEDLKSFISNCLEVNVALRPTCDLLLTHPFITGVEMTSPVKLVSTPELSSIAEERSIDMSSNTSTASNVDGAAIPASITNMVTSLHINRGGQPKSMRTRRSDLSMSSSSERD
ncbi:hypothetical protein M758_3G164500 [Ceratodon purpureus]|uniref:mitogen-activated protein kinase kinase kinase n=1 Tax=Ceratodon purpureus TaxID=3225 RepID=A0A8T0IJ84_CERPU|nr:hypothetical protein KC19_3G165100 [Ceratodon purpureus]KAG0623304.1 hypothetical protein M758_3G164500 [Ceratodon purpureus]